VYRQDPSVSTPSEEFIPSDSIGTRLSGPRVGIVTGRREFKARADRDGNYLYSPGNKKFNQVQAFVSAQKTLDLLQDYADRSIDWAFEGNELAVIPHAGEGKNAYYARWNQSVSFYSFDSRPLKRRVHTSVSSDVVSHETGHAILDGLKPEWGKTFDRETKATHEAFGDCAAMLLALSRPENRSQALEQTGGDLRTDNCISSIAEEFGEAVRLANRDPNDDRAYLRNANNTFQYRPPSELPRNGSREELSAEPHSFCQVFTRGFYNGVVNVYEANLARGMEPDAALSEAADVMGEALTRGVTMSAPNRSRYADVALGMLRAERLRGGEHNAPLARAFTESAILTEQQIADLDAPLVNGTPREAADRLGAHEYDLVRSVSDRQGNTTHEFLLSEETAVTDQGWALEQPLLVDVTAGLSLTYDGDGSLVHVAHQKKDAEAEFQGIPGPGVLLSEESSVEVARTWTERGLKLEQQPVFRD
jgi:hypothetical protein